MVSDAPYMSEQNRLTRLRAWWAGRIQAGKQLVRRLEYVGNGIRDRLDEGRDPYEIASWAEHAFQTGPPDDYKGAGERSCQQDEESVRTCESEPGN